MDQDSRPLEIEVRPAQTEDFADPQTEAKCNQHHGPVGLRQRVEDSPSIFHRENVGTVQKQLDASLAKEETAAIRADLLSGMVSSDDDRAVLSEQELAGEEEAQFVAVSAASIGKTIGASESELFAHEQKLLDEMTELAES